MDEDIKKEIALLKARIVKLEAELQYVRSIAMQAHNKTMVFGA